MPKGITQILPRSHSLKRWILAVSVALVFIHVLGRSREEDHFPDLYDASIPELQDGLDAGHFSSVDLVNAYFARIEEVNLKGPTLRAVLETNPSALEQAAALDEERRKTGKRSLMHGIPILLKDTIATLASEGMNTTAGSYALLGSIVPDDAEVVKRLRKAGAIILGKTNLSEFSHARGALALGWSGRGGQSVSAFYPNGDPCGSSSGSAIAVSIGLSAAALGTETDGSIACPASNNNIVGLKPTVGLISGAGVIPISSTQDSVGPMTRTVADSAILLSLAEPSSSASNYTRALSPSFLSGKRIGIPRRVFMDPAISGVDAYVYERFAWALRVMEKLGAVLVDPADLPDADEILVAHGNETLVCDTDLKIELNAYLEALEANPSGVRSLADLIAFNNAHPELEKPLGYGSQSDLIRAQATTGRNAAYYEALALNRELGATRGIDGALKAYNLDALVLPAPGFVFPAPGFVTGPPAIAGYPILTLPLGFYPAHTRPRATGPRTVYPAPGMPFGISFWGTKGSEDVLLGIGYAFERATRVREGGRGSITPVVQLRHVVGRKVRVRWWDWRGGLGWVR
ncbi:Putative amidase [Psilocybe cubensis]|uniref:Amidase domain-containing protein n=2 Tax=Psilocybe cubensis TaxID=181762 RepID=A0A8H7Y9S1_PSICU|nr:Putative amidase [Psilocybe cubensis]KAH9486285.1 Putative amidase [Psilocybe cubensis]